MVDDSTGGVSPEPASRASVAVVGVFVGGAASRYGGVPKGLLSAPSGEQSLVARLASIAQSLGLDVVLVGEHPAYATLGLPTLRDVPGARGPLGGLAALLEYAGERPAIALACDLPHVTRDLLARLASAPSAAVVAARRAERWEPLFARYAPLLCLDSVRAAISQQRFALQSLLTDLGARVLPLSPDEECLLHDWDSPADRATDVLETSARGSTSTSAGQPSLDSPSASRRANAHPRTRLEHTPLSTSEVVADVTHAAAGGVDVFIGLVRDHADGRVVDGLEYSAYEPMAERELAAIATEIEGRYAGVRVAARHRLGALRVGDLAVVCAASAPHRAEAFEACRELIEALKQRVPVWKRETGPDGSAWVGWVDVRSPAQPQQPALPTTPSPPRQAE